MLRSLALAYFIEVLSDGLLPLELAGTRVDLRLMERVILLAHLPQFLLIADDRPLFFVALLSDHIRSLFLQICVLDVVESLEGRLLSVPR